MHRIARATGTAERRDVPETLEQRLLAARRYIFNDCNIASYSAALRLRGRDPCLLGSSWAFDDWPEGALDPLCSLRVPKMGVLSLEESLVPLYAVEQVDHSFAGANDFWDRAAECAAPESPLLVWADTFHLEHTTNARSVHEGHRLLVLEATSEGARLLDTYGATPFLGWVERKPFASAVAGQAAGTACGFAQLSDLDPRTEFDGREPTAAEMLRQLPVYADSGIVQFANLAEDVSGLIAGQVSEPDRVEMLSFLAELSARRELAAMLLSGSNMERERAEAGHVRALATEWARLRIRFHLLAKHHRGPDGMSRFAQRLLELAQHETRSVERLRSLNLSG